MQVDTPIATPHLIIGGAKSGKSVFAEQAISAFSPPYIYLATAQVLDQEMSDRVHEHRKRRSSHWETIETPFQLVEHLHQLQGKKIPVLVDCLTLWLSNLLLEETSDPRQSVDDLANFLKGADYPVVLVSNEVGGGIVPDNPLARRFRDLAGWTNQRVAAICRTVTLIVAGLPVHLKQAPNELGKVT